MATKHDQIKKNSKNDKYNNFNQKISDLFTYQFRQNKGENC